MSACETWTCGDCGRCYPKSVSYCVRKFDDYLALRGGTVESAIGQAVERAIAPRIDAAMRKLRRPPFVYEVLGTLLVELRPTTNERGE